MTIIFPLEILNQVTLCAEVALKSEFQEVNYEMYIHFDG